MSVTSFTYSSCFRLDYRLFKVFWTEIHIVFESTVLLLLFQTVCLFFFLHY